MNKVAILIMAAGSSSRLGQAKQLIPYKEGTLLSYTIDECLASGLGDVSVILGANEEIIRPSIQGRCAYFYNPNWKNGLGNSIAFGVKQIQNENLNGVIIVLGDQPFFTKEILHQLILKKIETNASLVLSKYENDQGPPTYFSNNLFQELMVLEGDDGAKAVVQKHKDKVQKIAFEKGYIDIDKPEDLKWL